MTTTLVMLWMVRGFFLLRLFWGDMVGTKRFELVLALAGKEGKCP
jgi:hypothetical protein